MCGIAGQLYFNNSRIVTENEIASMLKTIAHRGPDDEGIYVSGSLGLGHRRLSIIDLSPLGHQPMSDDRKEVWLIFNGEIYNYQTLRDELLHDGVKFRSQADTEVIIYLYKKYGIEFLKKLRGMFAIALWDNRTMELILARDRIGKKPLKYHLDGNGIIFASELKAILAAGNIRKEVDPEAIDEFLTYKYVPAPKTGFKGIYKLPPAHYLKVDSSGRSELKKYWNLDYLPKENHSEHDWTEKIHEKLRESIKLRLISDVPLGAFLSGGIDSSLIVALMSELSDNIKTFSIGFKEREYDESPYARIVAKKFRTDHTEFVMEPESVDELSEIARLFEEPYADASAIAAWNLSRLTKEKATVALSGDGGDENFAGYNRYLTMKAYAWLKKMHAEKANPMLRRLSGTTNFNLFHRLDRMTTGLNQSPHDYFLNIISYFSPSDKTSLLAPEFAASAANSRWRSFSQDFYDSADKLSLIDRLLFEGINTHLPDDLLVKSDISSMAHALEVRSPMLDHEFMELCAKIPHNLKLKGWTKKYILKKLSAELLPKEIVRRPKKGFTVPVEYWFKDSLSGFINDNLLDGKFFSHGIVSEKGVRKLIAAYNDNQKRCSDQIWTLLMLRLWLKNYFE